VTGATSGIGAAFAAELPASTDVILTGRDHDRLDEAVRRLSRPGRVVEAVSADLATDEGVARVVDAAEAFGIDLLINNAGVGRLGAVVDNPLEAELATVRVNVVAVVALTRGLLPGMLERARRDKQRQGLVIVSSSAAFAPVPYFATYAASKAFDLMFAEALAEELRGAPIDVLAVCPGATRTSFGGRAGYNFGSLPGAADPRSVALGALRALGKETVHVSGKMSQVVTTPFLAPRRVMTGALGAAMRLVTSRSR
jgi:short-subunit dehydrogenase